MNYDIQPFLDHWDFRDDEPVARVIRANDGTDKIQLRVDLGLLQMEMKGRPDGERPHGCKSLLDYYRALDRKHPSREPAPLPNDACLEIQREVMQYYSRLNAFIALDWPFQILSDGEHLLDLLDLAADRAEEDEMAWRINQIYPFVRLAHARAAARIAHDGARFDRAHRIIEQAIDDIRQYYIDTTDEDDLDLQSLDDPERAPQEIRSLLELRDQLDDDRPRSPEENLQIELRDALAHENYERAAMLRDSLRKLHDGGARPPAKRAAQPPADPGEA